MKFLKKKEVSEEGLDSHTPDLWSRLIGLLSFSFVDLAGELMDLAATWRSSRRWKTILILLPVVLIALVLGTLVAIGKLWDKGEKVQWYVERAEKEVKLATGEPLKSETAALASSGSEEPAEEKAAPLSEEEARTKTQFIDVLFRRVLQLERNNKRALFYIAYQMSRYGKVSAARPIMESMAPEKSTGYEPAHAWLAGDMLQRGQKGEKINSEVLKHHLKIGTSREDASPALLVPYARLLQRDDQISEAEWVLKKAAKFDPVLLLNSVSIYMQKGNTSQAKASADLLVENIKNKFAGENGEEFVVLAAQAYVMTNRIEDGMTLLQKGFAQNPKSPKLRRAMSDAYRLMFRSSITKTSSQVQVNLDLLNNAIVIDPTNVLVQEELNMLAMLGIGQSESTMESLRTQIALNGTSFAARLIIAESSFRRGDLETAVSQYEVVLAGVPNMTLVLNNLAMLYTMLKPPKLDEAQKLIEQAIAVSPNVPEFYDTQGEIYAAGNRKSEAIARYLKVLELAPESVKTREKLIVLYDELGPAEEAGKQREELAKIKKAIQERQEKIRAAAKQAEKGPELPATGENTSASPAAEQLSSPTPTAAEKTEVVKDSDKN